MQFSNVPEVRTARRLLLAGFVLFTLTFCLNVVGLLIAFAHSDATRWLSLIRLVLNLVVPALMWRGYVLLAAMAERAGLYRQVIEQDLPRLKANVTHRSGGGARVEPSKPVRAACTNEHGLSSSP